MFKAHHDPLKLTNLFPCSHGTRHILRSVPDADGDEMTGFKMTEATKGQKMYVEPRGETLDDCDMIIPIVLLQLQFIRKYYYYSYN